MAISAAVNTDAAAGTSSSKDSPVVGILIDSAADDDLRRKRLYAGDVFVYKARPATLALCELARKILKAAFHPLHPRTAQHQLPVEKFAAILAEAKPAFIHDPMCKTLLPKILQDVGCDPEKTYFDVPRMRTSTCDGYLTSGIAYAFHPHRDVWYSAPMCQINWWLPVYDIEPENGMAFHPGYWSRGVENSSHTYNYAEWNKTNRHNAAQHVGRDTRVQPKANEEFDLSANFSIVTEVGGMTAFAGAQRSCPETWCN